MLRDRSFNAILVEHLAEFHRCFATLRTVRLIYNHSKAFVFGRKCDRFSFFCQGLHCLGDEGKLLNRRDDDGNTIGQGFNELLGVFVNLLHHALLMLKLVNGVLKLLVKDEAIGDDNDRVEYFVVVGIVQAGEPMG